MVSFFPRAVLVLTLALGVTGCETAAQMTEAAAPAEPAFRSVFDPDELTLAAGGYNPFGEDPAPPANVKDPTAFPDTQAFVNVMSHVVDHDCGNNVIACIARMRSQGKFKGIGGTANDFFKQVALEFSSTGNKPDYEVTGQINERCLSDPSRPGYEYDSGAKTVRLCVIVKSTPNRGKRSPVYRFYDVSATNVGVAPRIGDRFPEAATATGLDVHLPSNSRFNRKLYAAGTDIRVNAYWVTQQTDQAGKPDWSRGGKYNPSSGYPIFKEDEEACLDMMFEGDPPPTLTADYKPGVKYCLGRCANPPIVNTK